MDEDLLLLVVKAVVFVIVCLGLGLLLGHWIIWG